MEFKDFSKIFGNPGLYKDLPQNTRTFQDCVNPVSKHQSVKSKNQSDSQSVSQSVNKSVHSSSSQSCDLKVKMQSISEKSHF